MIRFYRVNDPYGAFSNFAPFGFILEGRHWPTSEHYFQAKKFEGTEYEEMVRTSATPAKAAELGRKRDLPLRTDWEQVKDHVMRTALRAKFTSHVELKDMLLQTGEEELVEATKSDYYWGCGTKGDGRNMLGVLLMELRSELRVSEKQASQSHV
jgi:N-glycosidase YbiA